MVKKSFALAKLSRDARSALPTKFLIRASAHPHGVFLAHIYVETTCRTTSRSFLYIMKGRKADTAAIYEKEIVNDSFDTNNVS